MLKLKINLKLVFICLSLALTAMVVLIFLNLLNSYRQSFNLLSHIEQALKNPPLKKINIEAAEKVAQFLSATTTQTVEKNFNNPFLKIIPSATPSPSSTEEVLQSN